MAKPQGVTLSMDKLATFLAVVVFFFVPVVLIVLLWMVHILPGKIAHKRHHPRRIFLARFGTQPENAIGQHADE